MRPNRSLIARFFSHVTNRIPSWLRDRTQDSFSNYPKDATFRYKNGYIDNTAQAVKEELLKRSQEGCEESEKFSAAIEEFRDPKNTTMVTDNLPKNPNAIIFLSHIVISFLKRGMTILPHVIRSTRLFTAGNIPPHSDGAATGKTLPFTSVSATLSNGSAETGFIGVDEIDLNLSKEAQEILRIPAFRYTKQPAFEINDRSSFDMPILYYDKDGSLNINLFVSTASNLLYDEDKIPFSIDKIDSALDEIHKITLKLKSSGDKTTRIKLKTGENVIMKNKRGLHYVTYQVDKNLKGNNYEINEETYRDVIIKSYSYEKLEDKDKPQTTSNSL